MTKRTIKSFNQLVSESNNQKMTVRELLKATTYRRELFNKPVKEYQTVDWKGIRIPDLSDVMVDSDDVRGFVKGFKDKGKITPTILLTSDGAKLADGHTSLSAVCYQSVIGVRSDITPDTELDCSCYTLKGEYTDEKMNDALDALMILGNARIETSEKAIARLILKKACTVKAASAACEMVQSFCSVSKAKGIVFRAVCAALSEGGYSATEDALRKFCNTQSKSFKVMAHLMGSDALEQLANIYDIDVNHDDINYESIHISMVEFMGCSPEDVQEVVEAEIVEDDAEPGRESGATKDEKVKVQFNTTDIMGIIRDMAENFKSATMSDIEDSGNMSEAFDYGQYLCWLTMLGWESLSYAEILAKLDQHNNYKNDLRPLHYQHQ